MINIMKKYFLKTLFLFSAIIFLFHLFNLVPETQALKTCPARQVPCDNSGSGGPPDGTCCPLQYVCVGTAPNQYCEYPGGGGGGYTPPTCPNGKQPICGKPAVISCMNKTDCKIPFKVLGICETNGTKVSCQTNCTCELTSPTPTPTLPPNTSPTPTNTPTLTPTTIPLICQEMREFVGAVEVTQNLSQIKFGDTVIFTAKASQNGQAVKSMTFQLLINGVLNEELVVPAVFVDGFWTATYVHTFNSYGTFRVRVSAVTPL